MYSIAVALLVFWGAFYNQVTAQNGVWELTEGKVEFLSEAPLEVIGASSSRIKGLLEEETGRFAFSIPISSFEGFNSPLQREHFEENYLETGLYPEATFSGRIIERIDFSTLGTKTIRAKGVFTIHGVRQERIIRVDLSRERDWLSASSSFTVLLSEHNIQIPRIVQQKISETIQVTLLVRFEKKAQ